MKPLVLLLGIFPVLLAQVPEKPVLGSVTGFVAERLQLELKPDNGSAALSVTFDNDTIVQRIAPGQTSLRNAETIAITSVAIGDRVLINFVPGTQQARRIVVMSANDIAKRQQQDREDWTARGITGIVAERRGDTVTLRTRASLLAAESTATVVASDKTRWRRYAPDSVKFADAIPATAADLKPGDQLRARGVKAADGLRVEAEEIVFGTFLSSAGTIAAIDAVNGVLTIHPLNADKGAKPLTVRIRPDSQIKRMPEFPGAGGGPGPGTGPMMGPGGGGRPGGGPGAGGGAPDIGRMIERMPAVTVDALKQGETIIVSSTKGATSGDVTAILLLANADFLIRMASQQQGAAGQQRGQAAGMGGMMGGGAGGMMGGGDFGAMLPGFTQ